ncbi:hypothetical protein FV139_17365 [Parahaliea maris]|uniref:DUF11 domain-containing protein n=1 Tax=Parahaliea maris TaxID=2716870 RepID=A0A5C8ZSV1_9GAMM|nr:hypothetical protein [Parahaliea maris]TXS90750.1 hypothetical protein FV139_17365 [Parahaliea maris]
MAEKCSAGRSWHSLICGLACFVAFTAGNSPDTNAAACPPDFGSVDRCTSNDLQPTGAEVIAGPAACTEGELVTATVRIYFENGGGASERYNVGFFVGDNGESPVGGSSCTFESLQPIGTPTDLTSGSGPYLELNGDNCGDISPSTPTYRDIQSTQLLCKDDDGDGRLDVAYVMSWDNNGNTASCADPLDPAEFTPDPPKCRGDVDVELPITVETPPEITVAKAAVPETLTAPGGEVTYYIAVHNDSSGTDPITITSLVDVPYGDLNGRGNCVLPATIAPGEMRICSFTTTVSGPAGTTVTDTVTAEGTDNEGNPVAGSASATVSIVGIAPTTGRLGLFKTAFPRRLPEPGGPVRYSVLAFNLSLVPVELQSLQDDLYGNLDGQGNCSLPRTLQIGSPAYFCQFRAPASGVPGDVITDTIDATGTDANGNTLQAQASASVTITDLGSEISVFKTPRPSQVREPGGDVTFEIRVRNRSAVDEVTLTSLNDSIYGNLDGQGTCALPQTLAPAGGNYTCSFTAFVSGSAGDIETNEVTAAGEDDDGQPVEDINSATVRILSTAYPPAQIDIRVIKTPSTNVITEPGAGVTFTLEVVNDSPVAAVSITSLVDSIYGDLNGQGNCVLPITIPASGASYSCAFQAMVMGQGGTAETNVVRAEGEDSTGNNSKLVYDIATVVIRGTPASLEATKTPSRTEIPAPGQAVQFTVTLSNTSVSDTVTVDALDDSRFGALGGQGTCVLPQSLPAGGQYTCRFAGLVNGAAGDVHVNQIVASGTSDDGEPVAAQAEAAVSLIDALIGVAIPLAGPGLLLLAAISLLTAGGLRLRQRRR